MSLFGCVLLLLWVVVRLSLPITVRGDLRLSRSGCIMDAFWRVFSYTPYRLFVHRQVCGELPIAAQRQTANC